MTPRSQGQHSGNRKALWGAGFKMGMQVAGTRRVRKKIQDGTRRPGLFVFFVGLLFDRHVFEFTGLENLAAV